MFVIIGIISVVVCVIGSYMAMGGKLAVLNQPFEVTIIFGAGVSAFVVGNPMRHVPTMRKDRPRRFAPWTHVPWFVRWWVWGGGGEQLSLRQRTLGGLIPRIAKPSFRGYNVAGHTILNFTLEE